MILPRKAGEKQRTLTVEQFEERIHRPPPKVHLPTNPEKAQQQARDRWFHLSLMGRAVQANSYVNAVIGCTSCTPEAKRLAGELQKINYLLQKELLTRIGC